MNRAQALEQIITFGDKIELAYSELAKFEWDSDIEHFTVSKEVLISILSKYLANEINSEELEDWANFIECRDDTDYESVEDYIYSLANPVLVGNITKPKIEKMVELLKAS
ncbi:hypothetical protein [Pseudocolwellia agarivorans]|uniref:hypothetical protein n=1 Tax=Pseudocolwellia agarivorans TaxID=1911682 RepID=UPI0009845178|nr:hypothetical protein [Pseudocolwellia agarivorans]